MISKSDEIKNRLAVEFRFDRPTIIERGISQKLAGSIIWMNRYWPSPLTAMPTAKAVSLPKVVTPARSLEPAPVAALPLMPFQRSMSGSSEVDLLSPLEEKLKDVQVVEAQVM